MVDERMEDIERLAEEEVAMLSGAEQAWIAQGNPKPIKQSVTFRYVFSHFGPSMIMLFIALIGAAYISSVRVGVLLEISQVLLIQRYNIDNLINIGSAGNTEAIRWFGMMAFEGVLIAWGLRKGQKNEDQTWSEWAFWMSLAVTIVAGALAGFTLTSIQAVNDALTVLFSVISGIGAPIMVAFAAENVGYVFKEIISLDKVFEEEWGVKLEEWKKEFASYVPYYMGHVYGVERRKKLKRFDEGDLENTPRLPSNESQIDVIRQYLHQNGFRPSEVGAGDSFRISPAHIVESLGLTGKAKDNIHTHLTRLRKDEEAGKWIS